MRMLAALPMLFVTLSAGPQQRQTAGGAWTVERSQSRVDQSPSLVVSTRSSGLVGSASDSARPSIAIRCSDFRTSVALFVGMQTQPISVDARAIRYGVDRAPTVVDQWSAPNGSEVLLAPHPREFIASIARAHRLSVEFTPKSGEPVTAQFAVSGLDSLIPEISHACGWDTPTAIRPLPSPQKMKGLVPGTPRAPANENQIYLEFQVAVMARPMPGTKPPLYPSVLRSANVPGEVVAEFVVDTTGRADMGSFRVLKTTHDLFAQSVRTALRDWTFHPAEVGGRRVRQLVQMPFEFDPPRAPR